MFNTVIDLIFSVWLFSITFGWTFVFVAPCILCLMLKQFMGWSLPYAFFTAVMLFTFSMILFFVFGSTLAYAGFTPLQSYTVDMGRILRACFALFGIHTVLQSLLISAIWWRSRIKNSLLLIVWVSNFGATIVSYLLIRTAYWYI